MTKGDVFVSTLGTGLKVVVKSATSKSILVSVERKLCDKRTGEISIMNNEREVLVANWSRFIRAYQHE